MYRVLGREKPKDFGIFQNRRCNFPKPSYYRGMNRTQNYRRSIRIWRLMRSRRKTPEQIAVRFGLSESAVYKIWQRIEKLTEKARGAK